MKNWYYCLNSCLEYTAISIFNYFLGFLKRLKDIFLLQLSCLTKPSFPLLFKSWHHLVQTKRIKNLLFSEVKSLRTFHVLFYKRHLWPMLPYWNKIKLFFASVPTQLKTSNLFTVLWKHWYSLLVFATRSFCCLSAKTRLRRKTKLSCGNVMFLFYERLLWTRLRCWNKSKLFFASIPTQVKTSNLLTV